MTFEKKEKMLQIPTCVVGGSDELDSEYIKLEIEKFLVKDIIDKINYKFGYFLVYFIPTNECVDLRISRFIYAIQQPSTYLNLHYKNEEMKVYTYIKKAPYELLN